MAHKGKVAEFNQELLAYRNAFEQEKINNERARREEDSEYVFRRETIRKKDQEQYDAKRRQQELELTDQRIVFENDFETREARLAAREKEHQQMKDREAWIIAREQEYQQLKDKAALFPEELRQAVQKVERSITDQLTRKYEYDAKLVRIESDSERKVYQQKITALEDQIEQYKQLKQTFVLAPEDDAINE